MTIRIPDGLHWLEERQRRKDECALRLFFELPDPYYGTLEYTDCDIMARNLMYEARNWLETGNLWRALNEIPASVTVMYTGRYVVRSKADERLKFPTKEETKGIINFLWEELFRETIHCVCDLRQDYGTPLGRDYGAREI